MPNNPQTNRPRSHSNTKGAIVVVAVVVVVLLALYVLLLGVPGTGFHGVLRPASQPTPTQAVPTGATSTNTAPPDTSTAPSGMDGTYIIDVSSNPQVPVADDPTDNPHDYAFYNVEEAHADVQGTTVTLTLTRLCLTYFENYVCVGQVPLTWTGTLSGDTAVEQDADHPVSWVKVTLAGDGTATLSRPNQPLCLLPDGSTVGTGDVVGDVHFNC